MGNGKLVYSQLLDFLDRNHFNYLVRKYEGEIPPASVLRPKRRDSAGFCASAPKRRDSARLRRSLSRGLPAGPDNQKQPTTFGRSGFFAAPSSREQARLGRNDKKAQRICAGLLLDAERARFELAIPFWGTHAFQACLFSHSSISPIELPVVGTANIRKKSYLVV